MSVCIMHDDTYARRDDSDDGTSSQHESRTDSSDRIRRFHTSGLACEEVCAM